MKEQERKEFLRARRQVIASYFSQLNPMQLQAALTTEGPLLLLAGAGSGKTTVLIQRIVNLIRFGSGSDSDEIPEGITSDDVSFLCRYVSAPDENDRARAESLCALNPIMPWNIIAITFTNKAANELKDRLEKMLGEQASGVWAMTFHSACCRILRANIDLLGYTSDFTIYDSTDSEKLMKAVIKDMGLDEKSFPAKSVLSAISSAKDCMEMPEEMCRRAKSSSDYRAVHVGKAFMEYQKRLRAANALDFDDIILLTVQLLTDYEEVRARYQQKFRYVLIDEYQDTNNLQYRLAALLAGRYENICVVGDDDQSIYRFRGATIENILSFESQYQGTRVIRLEQNYRSTGYILDAANAVISNNKGRKGKTLWTDNGKGEKITVREAANENDEGAFVASGILNAVALGAHFRDFAVLYRTNAQSNAIEMAFKRNGVPYRIVGGMRFFDRAEVKDMLAYLQLINNPSDDLRLNRILNVPPRGIGAKTIEAVQRQADAAGVPLFSVISCASDYPSLEKSAAKLHAFADMILLLRKKTEELRLDEVYELLLEESGYLRMLTAKATDENESRKENVQELKSSILSYMSQAETEPTLRGFLEEVSLYTDIEKYDQNADAAVMMTIHSAKGLEFPTVFLVGAEEGLFPGNRVLTDPGELEEERRLCYVALTRAEKQLYLSWARQRMLYGRTSFNKPSRFIGEIPSACIVQKQESSQRQASASRQTSIYGAGRAESASVYGRAFSRGMGESVRRPTARTSLELHKGDVVSHTAFGEGLILNVTPMGGDALLEIAFDSVGTKRLMKNSASAHMKKK